MTAGWETLSKFETVETRREGIFVMPKERITILSSYVKGGESTSGTGGESLKACTARADALTVELHGIRSKKLPS